METTGRDMIKAMKVLNIPIKKRELLKCAIEGQEIKPEDIPDIELDAIKRFEALLGSVQRNGIYRLSIYIKNETDFYRAPASTRFHSAYEGGLLRHSLYVYDCLVEKKRQSCLEAVPV